MVLALINCFALSLALNLHPFYVSVCEIYHNPKTQSLEISLKVFIDDIELAIQKSGNTTCKISEDSEKVSVENAISEYLQDRFVVEIDSKQKSSEVIGYEFEGDAIIFYIEIKSVKKINEFGLRNSIMTEVRDGQINLTHFQYNDQLKSFKTTIENPDGSVDVSSW